MEDVGSRVPAGLAKANQRFAGEFQGQPQLLFPGSERTGPVIQLQQYSPQGGRHMQERDTRPAEHRQAAKQHEADEC